jgi:hypothetical protein
MLAMRGAPVNDCISCGRDTAPGSVLFSARKRGRDTITGEEGFLCQACQPGSAALVPDQTIPVSGRYVVIEIGSMQQG